MNSLGWVVANVSATSGMLEDIVQRTEESASHLIAASSEKRLTGVNIAGIGGATWDAKSNTKANWRTRMNNLLERLGEADIGLLITVDEVDVSLDEMSHLVSTYQHFVRENRKVALVMAGLPFHISSLLSGKNTSFLRRAQRFELGPLAPYEVEEAFRLTVEEGGRHSVKVSYTYFLPTIPAAECTLAYEVFGDGRVRTTLSYDPVKELGDMPEFGVIFKFNADYDHVSWYGLGEAETYADRKKGAKLGIYDNMVKDNVARYMVPQECGAKEEVRWAKITDRKGRGMLFEMDKENGPMMFSALPYTPHEMENAMHPYELPQIHYTVVRVAKGQMGIAGDDSWGARTQEEYHILRN